MTDLVASAALPFAQASLSLKGVSRTLMLQAQASPHLDIWRGCGLVAEQTFKPEFDRLIALGIETVRDVTGPADLVLCLLTKHKLRSFADIARAWAAARPGGTILCCGAKDEGAASFEKRVRGVVGEVHSLSKGHARAFWFERSGSAEPPEFRLWRAAGAAQRVAATGLVSQPGLHGWDQIDEGSELLASCLPRLDGRAVADLGCGFGYLSLEIAGRSPGLASLDLYEADWRALEAARTNIDERAPQLRVGYHWHDVTRDLADHTFDWIVTNPPFHAGKHADADIGRAFIQTAARALKPGGGLSLVANRHLPYEAVLQQEFGAHWRTVQQTGRFKVFEAHRLGSVTR